MVKIMYRPQDVGKEILNKRKRMVKVRKYHMDSEEKSFFKRRWLDEVSLLPSPLRRRLLGRTGKYFFNPYRKGIYYYQIQTLWLLGANQWHIFPVVLDKLRSYMSLIDSRDSRFDNTWEKFRGKSARHRAFKCKDYAGRVQENFLFLQRLSRLHPYGYKLRQVKAAIDYKRVSKLGISNGIYYYRLSTYNNISDAWPIRDYKKYTFPQHERKYISYKFLGTIITKDKRIIQGVVR